MNHRICDECETVTHCSKHGCIPKQPAQQEPVAWIDPKHLDWLAQSPDNMTGAGLAARQRSADMVSLYTSPPASKPLTDDEFISMVDSAGIAIDPGLAFEIKEMVEAAHGIKENT